MNVDEIKQKIQESVEGIKEKFSGAITDVKNKLPAKFRGGNDDDEEYKEEEYEEEEGSDLADEIDDGEYYDDEEDLGDETGEMTPTEAVRRARATNLGINTDATSEIDMDATGELTGEIDSLGEEDEEEYEEEGEFEEEDEDQDEKAAQRSKIIRGAAVLMVVWFAADMILEDDTKKQAPKNRKQVSRKNKKSKRKNKKVAKKNNQRKENSKRERPKKEEIKDISVSKNTGKVAKDPTDTKSPVIPSIDQTENVETQKDVSMDQTEKPNDITNTYIDDPNSNMKDQGFQVGRKDGQIINNKVSTKIKEINISDDLGKILNETKKQVEQNVGYIAPPDYTKFGRGLVYNCKGKHWACIDRKRWFECKKNLKYTNFYGKEKECITVNVYGSQKDCRVMQLHNINTNTETSFCQ